MIKMCLRARKRFLGIGTGVGIPGVAAQAMIGSMLVATKASSISLAELSYISPSAFPPKPLEKSVAVSLASPRFNWAVRQPAQNSWQY